MKRMQYCYYYQAKIRRHDCWFFVATLRSFEHMAFDRTLDTHENIFEFLVPAATHEYFLEFMAYFQSIEMVSEFTRLPNRYETSPVSDSLPAQSPTSVSIQQ